MRLLFTLFFLLIAGFAFAIDISLYRTVTKPNLCTQTIASPNVRQWPNGKRQTLHANYIPSTDSTDFIRLKRKAKLAKWLGIGSLIAVLIPYMGIAALPAAIIGLILAGQVKKEAQDKGILRDADIGRKTSLATLILFVVAVIVVLALVAAFLSTWR